MVLNFSHLLRSLPQGLFSLLFTCLHTLTSGTIHHSPVMLHEISVLNSWVTQLFRVYLISVADIILTHNSINFLEVNHCNVFLFVCFVCIFIFLVFFMPAANSSHNFQWLFSTNSEYVFWRHTLALFPHSALAAVCCTADFQGLTSPSPLCLDPLSVYPMCSSLWLSSF